MKRLILFVSVVILGFVSCTKETTSYNHLEARKSPAWFRESFSYQLVVRNFSEEGTLKGAEKGLARLKDLGVGVIYLIPVCESDTDMDRSGWSPKQIRAGFNDPRNPYRISDYMHVDPEYGTDEDLQNFIKSAHDLGMKVFLDLVFAHCGPSAKVLKEHPEYFLYDENGNMRHTRWNFPMFDTNKKETRDYFMSVMKHYLTYYNADGFRCDVSDYVPISFWENARRELEKIKPELVMIAESEKLDNTCFAFDANYGWEICNDVVKVGMIGKMVGIQKHVTAPFKVGMAHAREIHQTMKSLRPKGSLNWNMYENHDLAEYAQNNRVEKVCGNACCELMLAFTFAIDGVPFIFNGQEIAYDKRLSFFGHKDSWINWNTDGQTAVAKDRTAKIKAWAKMRKEQKALVYGETEWIDNDRPVDVCSFKRTLDGADDVLFVGNFTDVESKVTLADGTQYTLAPFEYIFEPQPKK